MAPNLLSSHDGEPGRPDRSVAARIWPLLLCALALWTARYGLSWPIAQAYPTAAILLFVWVTTDALCLAMIARQPRRKAPSPRQWVAAFALASCLIFAGLPAPLRARLFDMSLLWCGMLLIVGAHGLLGVREVRARWGVARDCGGNLWSAAASALLPPALIRLARAEGAWLHLALFRWRAAADVPPGWTGFSCHRHIWPMMGALAALQLIELAVVHALIAVWSPFAALLLSAVSAVGLVYLVGLAKSLRVKPVLASEKGLILRTGLVFARFVSYADIKSIEGSFDGTDVRAKTTLNAALLAWPNVLVRLKRSTSILWYWRSREVDAIAIRLDDPAAFLSYANQWTPRKTSGVRRR